MTFAFATDDRSLFAFVSDVEACRHAEGIDVEDGLWLFFDDGGRSLVPVFTTPNEKGRFTVTSGVYSLHPNRANDAATLMDLLAEVSIVEGECDSVADVRQHLTNR